MKKLNTMRLIILLAVLAVGLTSTEQSSRGKEEPQKVETKKIPLESIYSTSDQEGVKRVIGGFHFKQDGTRAPSEPYSGALEKIERDPEGASNVLLVRGDDIGAAVQATSRALTAGHAVDEPVTPDARSKPDKCWLVAYLGAGPSRPPHWDVKAAHITGKKTQLRYTTTDAAIHTADRRAYFVWVPLGTLDPGIYTVELFDEDGNDVSVLRRVTIPKR